MEKKWIYSLVLVLVAQTSWAAGELDSEINDLQVKIVRVPQRPAKKITAQRSISPKIYAYNAPKVSRTTQDVAPKATVQPVKVASNDIMAPPASEPPVVKSGRGTFIPEDNNYQQDNAVESKAPAPYSPTAERKLVRQVELIPAYTISSFDGGDSSNLIPGGIGNPYNNSFNGSLLGDIDIGNAHLYVEAGVMYTQIGSATGQNNFGGSAFPGNTAYAEKVTTSYVGVPLLGKYFLSTPGNSSIFVKGGAIPALMVQHSYTFSAPNQNYEFRFGSYNTFDVMLDGGLGYDLKITPTFHAVADVSAFQGLLPVLTNYNVYNYGFIFGLGIAYMM